MIAKDQLKAENDSLLMELTQRNAELDEMMGTFNDISEGFRQINAAESRVDLQRGAVAEGSLNAKQQIASDIEFIRKQMEENKEQIAKLQAMLKNSKTNSSQLKKAVESLTQELNAKTQRIEELQAELASKNIRIQELDAAVTDLNAVKSELTAENEAKAKTVAEQDKALNTAWFVFGTKKELKDSGVKVEKQVSELEEIGCVVLELGYFIDFLGKGFQDPLSVVLSLTGEEQEEERVDISINEMLEEYVWSKD